VIDMLGDALELTQNTFTPTCQHQVENWLDECVTAHTKCSQLSLPANTLPTRLLKVSANLDDHVQLMTMQKSAINARYVTLSHCWSAGIPTVLNSKNLADLLSTPLSLASLPQIFRDAVKIARWMKADYIWIDALCIIQDSPSDWATESSKMYQYYTNTYCNIAATSAEPGKGCFTSRHISTVKPYVIDNPSNGQEAATHIVAYDDFWCNSLLDTDLYQRGWVIQERLLSPRTVHFGQEQIFWECRHTMACEAYPTGLPKSLRSHRTRRWRQADELFAASEKQRPSQWSMSALLALVGLHKRPEVPQPRSIYDTWSAIVEAYMDCKLSFGKDKLVAISGLAERFGRLTGIQYVAGLWWDKELFASSLLWYVLRRRQADSTPSIKVMVSEDFVFRGPSWSWASMDARICFNWTAAYGESLIEIHSLTTRPRSTHNFGNVEDATMHVRGHFRGAQLSLVTRTDEGAFVEDGRYALQIRDIHIGGQDPGTDAWIEPIIFLDTALLPSVNFDVWLLPVCTDWQGITGVDAVRLAGLILVKLRHDAGTEEFVRIGIFGMDESQAALLHTEDEGEALFSPRALRRVSSANGIIK
jgi:hypothetical protein